MAKVRRKHNGQRGKKPEAPIYQLKISLQWLEPAIWRRVQVPGDVTLETLHHVIQALFEWEDYHLHDFTIGDRRYGMTDRAPELDLKDEAGARLTQVIPDPGGNFTYTYDYGDHWEHAIEVEETLEPDDETKYPVCLDGEYAGPPEDCGGPPGFAELMMAINDPEHPEHEDVLEWVGEDYDPEEFDLEEMNEHMAWVRAKYM